MRLSLLAAAAAVLLGSSASASHQHHRRHGHNKSGYSYAPSGILTAGTQPTCGCTTYVTTIYGEPTCKFFFAPSPAFLDWGGWNALCDNNVILTYGDRLV
jgi:hypothetical protein